MRLNQYFAVLGQHIFSTIHHPIGIAVFGLRSGNVFSIFFLISIIVALPFVIETISVLNTDKKFTVFLIGAIHITDIATAENVAVTPFHTLVRANLSTVDADLSLSENVTVGI